MVITTLILSLLFVLLFTNFVFTSYFLSPTRYSIAYSQTLRVLKSVFSSPSVYSYFFSTVCLFFLFINLAGNIPGFSIPSLFYYYTASVSLTLWFSLIVVVYYTQLSSFISHMLPYGAPSALSLFLPLIEIFSHLIRPLTLMVRIRTNLSSGHIMLFMFSFFSLSSFSLTVALYLVLTLLFILELMISALQAYIFSSLALLYVTETL